MSAPTLPPLAPEVADELDSIDRAREAVFAKLREHNASGLISGVAQSVLDAMDDVDRRAEAVRRAVWPRHRGRLIVVHGGAYLMSRRGRWTRQVWRRS